MKTSGRASNGSNGRYGYGRQRLWSYSALLPSRKFHIRAQDILPDHLDEARINGTAIRKGTVGAFLANAAAFSDPAVLGSARQTVLDDIAAAVPALRALGLFVVLEIRDPQLRAFVEAQP
ncbi:hypothetical protein [Xylophilus sp. GOD-11R]|uniref:hypothetical protein n=1 Tax=Xylophilus sp. GOD-11R TaxID=3089814 RepID=UPI00298BE372|nr:hypothetical protein [Xylophilus sp. GOD-11R]WPB55041.1 hypothetical protein R9X41_12765 [Xylophilus sp. GOD-11R]